MKGKIFKKCYEVTERLKKQMTVVRVSDGESARNRGMRRSGALRGRAHA